MSLPSKIGVNLAKGIGVGFENEMVNVNRMIQNSIPTDFNVNPNINSNALLKQKQNDRYAGINEYIPKENNFNVTINNNSKFTSPAENVRLLRKERELYKLKYGG